MNPAAPVTMNRFPATNGASSRAFVTTPRLPRLRSGGRRSPQSPRSDVQRPPLEGESPGLPHQLAPVRLELLQVSRVDHATVTRTVDVSAEADHHHVSCVCLFTLIPSFFAHFEFRVVTREDIPDKLYKDCLLCPKLHACDEIAMVRGELPKFAILGKVPVNLPLVKLGA